MNKRNFQALVMTCVMITSVMLSGCNNSGKKSGKKSKAEKDVTALLDDVCAYIKSAKSSKLERLIDGRSKWVGALEDYSEAEVKDVFEAARKRIDYSIEDVKADDEEGEALIVFSYFDTKDCKKSIDRDSTNKEIAKAVADAKDEEIEVEVEVVYDDEEWLIDADSFDEICETLFGFIDDLDMETVPPPTTTKATTQQVLSESYYSWYDDSFHEVEAYHQSTDYIRLMLCFWDYVQQPQTLTYEYEDYSGIITSGSVDVEDGDSLVYIDWEPDYKLPVGWISCTVYDGSGNLITVACVEIIDDNEKLPVKFYCYSCEMTDENGIPVPGYHVSDKTVQAMAELDTYQDVELTYALFQGDPYGASTNELYRNTIFPTSEHVDLAFDGVEITEAGEYSLIVYDMRGDEIWDLYFDVLADGKEFEMDADKATSYYDCFTKEEGGFRYIDKIPKDANAIIYYVYLEGYVQYMQFTWKAEDGNGKTLCEGYSNVVTGDELKIDIDVSELTKGPLKVTVYNPDGSVLVERTIEEES